MSLRRIQNSKNCISKNALFNEKTGKWMSFCCTLGYKWVTVMDGIKFESNDIISLYTKNDSERKVELIF